MQTCLDYLDYAGLRRMLPAKFVDGLGRDVLCYRLTNMPACRSPTRKMGLYIHVAVSNHVNIFLEAAEGSSPLRRLF